MTIDMSFTQDPEWIKQRQAAWELIEDGIAEGRTKKQFEARKNYFFSGIKTKEDLYPDGYVLYFPKMDEDGLAYVFRNLIESKVLSNHQLWGIETKFSLNLDSWPGATYEQKIKLFKIMYGETFDLQRKFPFLIGNETKYREFTNKADDQFSILTDRFRGLFIAQDDWGLIWSELDGYYLSLIPHVSPWIFLREYTEEQGKTKIGGLMMRSFHPRIDGLFQQLVAPSEHIFQGKNSEAKQACRQRLYDYFENVKAPAELVSRWQWAKAEYGQ